MTAIHELIEISPPKILVLAKGTTKEEINHKKGHLFEKFVARLLEFDGYSDPSFEDLNVTSQGIELDVSTVHRLSRHRLIAECKAYTTNLKAKDLTNFYGKLAAERLNGEETVGLFVAIPGLVAQAKEKLNQIQARDRHFKCWQAREIFEILLKNELLVRDTPTNELLSDFAVLITEHGIFSAAKSLDRESRTPISIICWSKSGVLPDPVVELVQVSKYGEGISVRGASTNTPSWTGGADRDQTIVPVSGSTGDFEYQLPASPKYFVGRKQDLRQLSEIVDGLENGGEVVVFNGQSGWGKSSLALRFASELQSAKRGSAVVFDARTAANRDYVRLCMQKAILKAQTNGILRIGDKGSFASLSSIVLLINESEWLIPNAPVAAFFDQFENVFRDADLTAEFRDLAYSIKEVNKPFIVGFSWKTDFVTWAENHPYQLRDEIRTNAKLLQLEPLGPGDINTLLRRLERVISQKLSGDLKSRLREYSQGLPWLFKKLASHVISEIASGITQTELLDEALNVRTLFDSDLRELTPEEIAALKRIARVCPVSVSEIVEVVPPQQIQSFIDRRLLVSVGEFLDTYWDIFRDFLITGEVPIKESYILRQTPNSAGRFLHLVKDSGGTISVQGAAKKLGTSEGVVFNTSRELRLMGVLFSDKSGTFSIADEVLTAVDFNEAVHARISRALKRNKAFDALSKLVVGDDEGVQFDAFAAALPSEFAGVQGSERTWKTYARAFLKWFEYGRLITVTGSTIQLGVPQKQVLELVDAKGLFGLTGRLPRSFPQSAPRPALELAKYLARLGENPKLTKSGNLKALNDLRALGIARFDRRSGQLVVEAPALFHDDGRIDECFLRDLIDKMPGASDAFSELEGDPTSSSDSIGFKIASGYGKEWSAGTTQNVGKYFRAWAQYAGVATKRPYTKRK
ncbi:MAG: restriction endonuclease [Planctomycetaceae bacterium]